MEITTLATPSFAVLAAPTTAPSQGSGVPSGGRSVRRRPGARELAFHGASLPTEPDSCPGALLA